MHFKINFEPFRIKYFYFFKKDNKIKEYFKERMCMIMKNISLTNLMKGVLVNF